MCFGWYDRPSILLPEVVEPTKLQTNFGSPPGGVKEPGRQALSTRAILSPPAVVLSVAKLLRVLEHR